MNRLVKVVLGGIAALGALQAMSAAQEHHVLFCNGAKVYSSPTDPPLEAVALWVKDGKIDSITPDNHLKFQLARGVRELDCKGKVVVPGYWNSHVHFTSGWEGAKDAPADKLTKHMQEMLTRWGFTTVWDLGSNPDDTLALRKRVESGEVLGPKILMAGDIFPKNGHPVYLPAEMQLPEAATPQEAEGMAQRYMKMDMDGIKLFTGSYMGPARPVVNMDPAVATAAVAVAHAQSKPVFAHPQNRVGTDSATNAGVDVQAHTIPTEGQYTAEELANMTKHNVALTPTLALWPFVMKGAPQAASDQLLDAGVHELKQYHDAGGTILFGTDVGFVTEYDPSHELEYMGRVMSWQEILASLTVNPSKFFHAANKGKVETGMDADFVVLDGDPAEDVKNFAKVVCTVRDGRVIYSAAEAK